MNYITPHSDIRNKGGNVGSFVGCSKSDRFVTEQRAIALIINTSDLM